MRIGVAGGDWHAARLLRAWIGGWVAAGDAYAGGWRLEL